jgi:hypothetical protein
VAIAYWWTPSKELLLLSLFRFDAVRLDGRITGGMLSTAALKGSTEEEQFAA